MDHCKCSMKTVLLAEFGRFSAVCKITHRTVTASVSLAAAQNAATGEERDSVLHEVHAITRRKNIIDSWIHSETPFFQSQGKRSDSGLPHLLHYYHWKRVRGGK